MAKPNVPVHRKIREVAVEFAHELFDAWLTDERLAAYRKVCPELRGLKGPEILRKKFVAKAWPTLIDRARDTMVDLLTSPTLPDDKKDEIHQALILDSSLGRGKIKTHIVSDLPH